jgi:hypothetical protein
MALCGYLFPLLSFLDSLSLAPWLSAWVHKDSGPLLSTLWGFSGDFL